MVGLCECLCVCVFAECVVWPYRQMRVKSRQCEQCYRGVAGSKKPTPKYWPTVKCQHNRETATQTHAHSGWTDWRRPASRICTTLLHQRSGESDGVFGRRVILNARIVENVAIRGVNCNKLYIRVSVCRKSNLYQHGMPHLVCARGCMIVP